MRVGTIRPSQAIHSYGVGSLIDLPNLSVMVGGLDRWDTTRQAVITEDRLLDAVRARLGPQVDALRALPVEPQTTNNPYDDWARVGVPVTVFPRWLRCTACNRLFPVASGALKLDHNPYRIDRTRYTHPNCDKARRPPPAVPARFVAGCANGHLDDFPWVRFAHDGVADLREPDPAGQRRRLRWPRHRPAGHVPDLRRQVDAGQGVRPGRQDDRCRSAGAATRTSA